MSGDNLGSLRIALTSDRMEAWVHVPPGLGASLDALVVGAMLDERGVARSQERDAAVAALIEQARREPHHEVAAAVVKGTPPVHGEDAWFEPASAEPHQTESTDATHTDHRAACPWTFVRSGGSLGVFHAATPGLDGVDVTGAVVAAKPGRRGAVSVDPSVRIGADGLATARWSGVVEASRTRVAVERVLRVGGYVDFSTGNIDCPCDVEVSQGVRDGFTLISGGDVAIAGLVEAAHVAARDVRLSRGMAGREKGVLEAARDLHTHYIEGTTVAVGRDLAVDREIVGCRTIVGRRVAMPGGTIIGGELIAAGRIDVLNLGSEARAPTSVVCGRIPGLETHLSRALEILPSLEHELAQMKDRLAALQRASGRMNTSQADEQTGLQFDIAGAQAKHHRLLQGLAQTIARLRNWSQAELVVGGRIHKGVRIWIGACVAEPRDEQVVGPLSMSVDHSGKPVIRMGSETQARPLSSVMRVMPDSRFVDLTSIGRDLERRGVLMPLAA
jgi:uncharacterized protein (DUF342 family)